MRSYYIRVKDSKTRECRLMVRRERFKMDLRGNIVTWMVIIIWNELPKKAIEADIIMTFKTLLG